MITATLAGFGLDFAAAAGAIAACRRALRLLRTIHVRMDDTGEVEHYGHDQLDEISEES